MKVRIAFVTNADGEADVDRIGTIEDHPDEDAKQLIKDGIAAVATDDEIAEYEALVARRKAAAEEPPGPRKGEPRTKPSDVKAEVPTGESGTSA